MYNVRLILRCSVGMLLAHALAICSRLRSEEEAGKERQKKSMNEEILIYSNDRGWVCWVEEDSKYSVWSWFKGRSSKHNLPVFPVECSCTTCLEHVENL